jgi:hypothetical protein
MDSRDSRYLRYQFMLLLLCAIYHGPRSKWFVKHGIADFGDFIVIFLILSKVQEANSFTVFHDKFPQGSVMMIETFLRIFPLLTPRQKDVLARFTLHAEVGAFLRENVGEDWMRIFHKYEGTFRVILDKLFENGLTISPNYKGRYTCPTAKLVVARTIYWLMEKYTCQPKDDPSTSLSSQQTAFAIAIMRDYRHNLVFQLYLETMVQMELTNDPICFKHAGNQFRNIIANNFPHYEAWLEFIAEIEKRTHVRISPDPRYWDSKLICWLMNSFQSYKNLSQYLEENPAKN